MGTAVKDNNILTILVFLLIFTALRGLTPLYYALVVILMSYLLLISIKKPIKTGFHAIIFYVFLMYSLLVIVWSALYMESWDFLPGVPRLLLMQIVVLILFDNIRNDRQIEGLLKILLLCYVIGALTIIYQIIFGAIPWFAPQFIRAGLDRYASILGSLTIYGAIAGYALLMLYANLSYFRSNIVRITLFFVLMGGVFFSLSKAGVVMVLLSLIVFIAFNFAFILSRISIRNFIYFLVLVAVVSAIMSNTPELQSYYNAVVVQTIGADTIFADSSSVMIDSEAVSSEHIIKRLTHWSSGMIKEYGDIVYFIGVGLQGGAGVMGMHPDVGVYGSAHNSFGDLFFMGGSPYLLIFMLLYTSVQFTHYKNRRNHLSNLFFMLNILFLANMTVASGSVFNPAISFPFWLSVVYAYITNGRRY